MPIVKTPGYKEYLQLLRRRLPADKVSHCVFTAEYLSSFVASIGVDHDQAVRAALLHDLCRELEQSELLRRAEVFGLSINEYQLQKPTLLHGPVAAEECRRDLGIQDPDHYDALYWHTTGRPGYCRLGQALYFADFAEPTRGYAEARTAREVLRHEGFDEALLYVARTKIAFLRKRAVMDPNTEAFVVWLDGEIG